MLSRKRAHLARIPLLWALSGLVAPASAGPTEIAASRAEALNRTLPMLEARAKAADTDAASRERYFAAKESFVDAFYALNGRNLDDPAVVAGLLAELDDKAASRALERVSPLPDLGDARATQRLAQALDKALDAEDRADALQRRLLVAVAEHLAAQPDLTDAGLAPLRAPSKAVLAQPLPDDAAAAQAQARQAAQADKDLALLAELVQALRERAVQRDAPLPSPDADLDRLVQGDGANAAARRLLLLRPFLTPEAAARCTDALVAWLRDQELPAATAARDAAQLALTEAETETIEANPTALKASAEAATLAASKAASALAALPPVGADALVEARRSILTLRAEAAGLTEQAATLRLTRGQAENEGSGAAARRTQEAADDARQQADAAALAARDSSERRAASLLKEVADSQDIAAAAWTATNEAAAAGEAASQAHKERMADLQGRSSTARKTGVLGVGSAEADAVNRALREEITSLRSQFLAADDARLKARAQVDIATRAAIDIEDRIAQERETLGAIQPEALRASVSTSLEDWLKAAQDTVRAAASREAQEQEKGQETLRNLQRTRTLRQQNLELVSANEASAEQRFLLPDIGAELRFLGPRTRVRALDALNAIQELPSRLLDFSLIKSIFIGSFWVLLVVAGWALGRRRAPTMAAQALDRIAKAKNALLREDLAPVEQPLARAFETFLDLLVGWLIAGPITGMSQVVGLVISLYLHLAVFRFVMAIYQLAFAKHPSVRPSLRTLTPESHDRLGQTVRWVLYWAIARNLIVSFLPDLLGLYTLTGLARTLFTFAGILLGGGLLYWWAPDLRGNMKRSAGKHPLLTRLASDPPIKALGILQAAGILVFGGGTALLNLLPQLFKEGSGLGRLAAQVSPLNISQDADQAAALALPEPEQLQRMTAAFQEPAGLPAHLEAPRVAVLEALKGWNSKPMRGLAVLTGDHGSGKSLLIGALRDSLSAEGTRVQVLDLNERLTSRTGLLNWLCENLGIEAENPDEDTILTALQSTQGTVFILDDLQEAFLRTVDGFGALRALLYVMNASGQNHFWLVSVHRPAWAYLKSLGGLLDTTVARSTIDIPAMGERDLRAGIEATTGRAGLRIHFDSMVRPAVFTDEPKVEQERATRLFFRLLREGSGGNPQVAATLWKRCLRASEGDQLQVVVDASLSADPVKGQDLVGALILHAILTHDQLNVEQLVAVTNLPEPRVRSTVKDLTGRSVIEDGERDTVRISTLNLVPTVRLLRRLNLIPWTV